MFDATRENVLAHERVGETVMRNHTVIPMSFGTVFKTRDDIVELLRAAYEAFNDVLNKMQDKLEFGLKVLGTATSRSATSRAKTTTCAASRRDLVPEGLDLLRAHAIRPLMDAAPERSERYVRDIFEQLRRCRWPPRQQADGDKMIMNAAFLVAREKKSAFDAKVKQIGARHGS